MSRHEFAELLPTTGWTQVAQDYRLTPQELKLVRLLTRGLANAQIGDRLNIAPPTVRTHLRSIYRKFNQTSRTGVLLVLAHRYCAGRPGRAANGLPH
ncbi:MAG TPA: LuxR C-terminal-related transcriptional regulator [Phycisphaerae bacterium]|nr:LuxR C-terminal-related transcriptional regulator [Phycisphaerae bacterium]